MKKQLFIPIVVLAAVITLVTAYDSIAEMSDLMTLMGACYSIEEMCDCICDPGDGMSEDGPSMPQGLMHQDMEMMEEPGDGFPLSMTFMGLGLDEKQKEEAREIESGLMKSTVRMKSDIQIATKEMKDILDKYPVDMKAVESKLKMIESLQTSVKLSGIKALEEVKSILTAGQRIKLKKMLERGLMMGRMMHEGPEVH